MQQSDFEAIFQEMRGLPVTIRLLDPPLHEFLPQQEEDIAELAKTLGADPENLRARIMALHETNPMLGHRGCRLGITYPEIYEMQARAILEAAAKTEEAGGQPVELEIMIPLVGFKSELDFLAGRIAAVADDIRAQKGSVPAYCLGTMIELPRAALGAGELAQTAEFFSFGTNDLTQTVLGLSRDDAGSILADYLAKGLVPRDPFVSMDVEGVGELIRIAAERGRAVRKNLKLGVCGEHGGDPASIFFCRDSGLDNVSCLPVRVPIARLSAAQAVLRLDTKKPHAGN